VALGSKSDTDEKEFWDDEKWVSGLRRPNASSLNRFNLGRLSDPNANERRLLRTVQLLALLNSKNPK